MAITSENTFNAEFGPGSVRARVPVTRVDFSGYGASLFSHWQNPKAIIAETSQVYFDVMVAALRMKLCKSAVFCIPGVSVSSAP